MGPSASTVQPPAVPAGQPAIQAPETPLGTYTGPTPQTTSTKNASMWDCIKQKLSSRFPDAAPGTIPDEEVVKANRECVGYQ
ncbi:MAG: hypothetical protein J4203_06420 [Candidatus Diapherotrites archaeon]|uniref:Uncharacterized protein n=1 Tax=Candidatus Iainarchaeum sp. TaxID=3101447 RepID=A0A8T4L8C7_9ARCH|nr:hypothetical protein [Candidatus Diapherotrites archaeon]